MKDPSERKAISTAWKAILMASGIVISSAFISFLHPNGWMSATDIRELENLDRIPAEAGGDLYLINGNMTKLEDAGQAYVE